MSERTPVPSAPRSALPATPARIEPGLVPPASALPPPGQRAMFWLTGVAVLLTTGTLRFLYVYLDDLSHGHAGTLTRRLVEESTGVVTAAPLFAWIITLDDRHPLTRATWRRVLPMHAAGLLIYSVLHTALMAASRAALFPSLGLGHYDYGTMPIPFFMELPNDAIFYAALLTLLVALRTRRALRDREVHAAELERVLAQTQLRNLQLQLQPHFLFNALNTISERMYDDPTGADAMVGHLADLLRRAIRAPLTQEVPLADELELLDHYLAILRARFGDALRVTLAIAPPARTAAVPALVLQPLVENAVRHGPGSRGDGGCIRVSAALNGPWLDLEVADDGPGIPQRGALVAGGVGLATTRERLALLYGSAHRFTAGNEPSGGFAVRMRIPYRPLGHTAPVTPSLSTPPVVTAFPSAPG